MGQYYYAYVKLESGEVKVFSPFIYGDFCKLMEHSWLLNSFVNVIVNEIKEKNCMIAWVGDYAEESDVKNLEEKNIDFSEVYADCWKNKLLFKDGVISSTILISSGYLIDHTKKIYLDLKRYREQNEQNGRCVNPLPLLTAVGNGKGCGDYLMSRKTPMLTLEI